jgi:calcium/calmodulin-dependent protein kinase I
MDTGIYKTGSIKDAYKLDKILGEGSFAVVRKGIKKSDNDEVAIKIIDKTAMESDDQIALQNEVEILSQIDHPNIVKLQEIYDEKTRFNMVMELMSGGELFDRIVEREHYSEKEAADTIRPIVDAIRYCHAMGIAHRDLKPENLLYATPDPNSIIKITDFGLAKVISNDLMTTACGTPGYVAPEILMGKGYDLAIDYWSIGVIVYVMLCGYPPFYEESNEKLFEKIKTADYEFASPYWDDISDYAKDLISKLLIADPKKRLDADQILAHPWIVGDVTPRKKLPQVTEKIKEFNAKRRFKRAQLMVMAANKWRNLVKAETN